MTCFRRETKVGNQGELKLASWLNEQVDVIWLHVNQNSTAMGEAFRAKYGVQDSKHHDAMMHRIYYGCEIGNNEEEENYISPEGEAFVQRCIEDYLSRDGEWHENMRKDGCSFIQRPDFICFSSKIDRPGVCFIDAKVRLNSDNTIKLTTKELDGLRNLQSLTGYNVWIACLSEDDSSNCKKIANNALMVQISSLSVFRAEPCRVKFQDGRSEAGWKFDIGTGPGIRPFSLNDHTSFDVHSLFVSMIDLHAPENFAEGKDGGQPLFASPLPVKRMEWGVGRQ